MEAIDSAKAYLKNSQNEGVSLYDHLSEVLLAIATEKPSDAYKEFEAISVRVKESTVLKKKGAAAKPVKPAFDDATRAKLLAAINSVALLCKPPAPQEDEEEKVAGQIPDLLNEARLLQWAGVSLGEQQVYKLLLAIERLTKEKSLASARFFGVIHGTQADYFIVETKLNELPEEPENSEDPLKKNDPIGQGVNEYVYFVANDPVGQWTQLPTVTTEQIKLARQMRRMFSGNLAANVPGYPRFRWSEASYLRAQIARISAATLVCPKGYYKSDEENASVVVEDEEFKGVPASELKSAENWTHQRPLLLKQARYSKWVKPESNEEEESEAKAEENPEDLEEEVAPLRALNEDASENLPSCWSFRVAPTPDATSSSAFPHAVAVAKSLVWPGAVAAAQSGPKGCSIANIYVGYGLRHLGSKYIPPALPQIQADWKPEAKAADDSEEAPAAPQPLKEQTDPLPPPPEPEQPKENEENAEENGDEAPADEEEAADE